VALGGRDRGPDSGPEAGAVFANGYLRLDARGGIDKPPLEVRKNASLLGSDRETDAMRRRGCDENNPTVIRDPRSLERSSRFPVGDVQHHDRLIPTHVFGHILDRGASIVRHFVDLTEIDGDTDMARSQDTGEQAPLVFFGQSSPSHDVWV
jgi:hypothetical protein